LCCYISQQATALNGENERLKLELVRKDVENAKALSEVESAKALFERRTTEVMSFLNAELAC